MLGTLVNIQLLISGAELPAVNTKMTQQQQKQCDECSALVDETKGRMVILDQESPKTSGERDSDGGGFQWSFLCIHCVRDWRERGLRREGLSPEETLKRLETEFPILKR